MHKKIHLFAIMLAGMATSVSAEVLTQFKWITSASNLVYRSGDPVPAGAATVLTYLSQDSHIDFDMWSMLNTTYDDDFLYATSGNMLDGRMVTSSMIEDTSMIGYHNYAGYYAYAIVISLPFSVFNSTYGGNVFQIPIVVYWSSMNPSYAITDIFGPLQYLNTTPPKQPQLFNAGNLMIPEPATFMLFGIGGFGAWIIRRNKLKTQEDEEGNN